MNPLPETIVQAAGMLRRGDCTSSELTRAFLERIEALEPRLGAFISVLPDQALDAARRADRAFARWRAGQVPEPGPLTGIPLALKDNLCTAGLRTTCGSRILEQFAPPYDATVVVRLREAGAVLLGKTNLDEFAMGSSTENSAFGPTRNPWDPTRVPGGSSGGSAAAVAAGECLAALGSDTGGSVRQPAALCGVVGLKPSYGRVSRYGLVAFASSLDVVGVLTRNVRDAALLLEVIAGPDERDATTAPLASPGYGSALHGDLQGIRVGIVRERLADGIQPEVAAAVSHAVRQMQALGAEVREVSLPHTEYALPAYYLVAPAEASSNLARYDGIRYGLSADQAADLWDGYRSSRQAGFGAEVKRRIMLGTYALSAGYYDAYYLKAQKARTLIQGDFDRVFASCHVLVGPTTPTAAFPLGQRVDDPLQMYLSDVFTIPANLAGLCSISVPCGFAQGLPVGLQITAPAFHEERLLAVAHAYQESTTWRQARPPILAEGREARP
ncbi:MAG: Asp-tRNA(Asn)/Glu-tRNA(Gln) amidotransferase subunit GatA [Chloroflexi bacterium]|nr:Asp-tRNA(Asn)/Glu-tRNA(Gln) amidotransferase subunit GatA [Chloroflexota bacterium]